MAEETAALPSERFSPGRTLSTSFAVLGRNLVTFLVVTAVISLPYIAIQTWADMATAQAESDSALGAAGVAMMFVQTVIFALVQAALTYGTIEDLRGGRASIGDCFRRGLARSGKIAGASLQYGIMIGLATLLLIVPGVLLFLRWWVFMPAMVVEGLKPNDSFGRSTALTAGRRWQIFGMFLLIMVVYGGLEFTVMAKVGIQNLAAVMQDPKVVIGLSVFSLLLTAYAAVMTAVGYYYLRAEKEGIAIDDIAAVFG